jgi:hypothetical protein
MVKSKDNEMGEMRLKGRHHSDDLGVDGRIILKWILGK